MAPWDEFAWFDTPTETRFTSPALGKQLCQTNVRRVILIFSVDVAGVGFVSMSPTPTSPQGIQLSSTQNFLIFTQKDHGPLAQVAWFWGSSTSVASLTVIEVFLRDWPHTFEVSPTYGNYTRAESIDGPALSMPGPTSTVDPEVSGTGESMQGLWPSG